MHISDIKIKTEQNVSSVEVIESLIEVYEGYFKCNTMEKKARGCRVVFLVLGNLGTDFFFFLMGSV